MDRNTWNHKSPCKLVVLDKNTWYLITACKLFVLDKNTWYHITVCKLFVLDKNTWYHITVCKEFKKQVDKQCKYKCTIYIFSSPPGIRWCWMDWQVIKINPWITILQAKHERICICRSNKILCSNCQKNVIPFVYLSSSNSCGWADWTALHFISWHGLSFTLSKQLLKHNTHHLIVFISTVWSP